MTHPHVYIEISPSRIELAVFKRNETVAVRSKQAAQPDWGGSWPDVLSTLSSVLAGWVNELKVSGASAVVLYSMPTTAAGVMSCPASVGAQAEQRSALLALGGMAGFAVEGNPHSTRRLMLDTDKDGDNSPQQSHTLAAADTEATAALVAGFVRACGLVPTQLVPTSAVELSACVNEVSSQPDCGAVLWVGAHGSVFAAGSRSSLRFVRSLSIGLEALIDAMTRPGRSRGGEAIAALDRTKARDVLATVGVPDHQHAEYASLVPLMTPVLQRLANEVKQSLRFGLNEQERSGVRIRIAGAGAGVARLGEVLTFFGGASIEATTASGPGGGSDLAATSAAGGAIAWLRALPSMTINLAPAAIIAGSRSRSIRRAAYAGLGVCVAAMALEAGWAEYALSRERAFLETARRSSAAVTQREAVQSAAMAAVAQQRLLDARVRAALGQSTDWAGVMALLSSATPSNVRLTMVEMTASESQPALQVVGVVNSGASTSSAAAASAVKAYADALSASTLVQGVKMGSAARGGEDDGSLRFELQVTLVGVPTTLMGRGGSIAEGSPR